MWYVLYTLAWLWAAVSLLAGLWLQEITWMKRGALSAVILLVIWLIFGPR
jgi:hypothetical protein